MRCLHVALLVATAMMSLSAFATASQSDMTPWRPDESYAGKAQADSRLDKPVRFWGAGILLADVFSQVREQTGVEIGFYPENDENRRVPVHLFLNPKNPPTLRSLMAQLSWVVDCPFLAADSPEGRSYYLMSSSVGAGAQERLQKAVEEIWEARKGRWQAIGSKLDEYRQALDLPRDGLIDRYRSKDDLMLLNLLDPARRAATQFMCRHATAIQAPEMPGEQAGAGELEGFGQTVPSTDFTDDDITDLKAAFGLPDSVLRDPGMAFDIHVEAVGRLRVNAAPEYTQKAGRPSDGHFGPYLIADLTDGFALSARDELSLRRALGESIPAEQESEQLRALEREIASAKRERETARLDAERSLSPRAKELLQGTELKLRGIRPGAPIAPWMAQEKVARATGLDVVSDGMLWLDRYFWPAPAENERTETEMNALAALDSFTHNPVGTGMRRPSWEWGDAGDFLRFRTADRDIWRAAMLPQKFLDWVDSLIKPYMPEADVLATRKRMKLAIPVGLVYMVRMLGRLSDLQMQFGVEVNHSDPTDASGIVRHQAIVQIVNVARRRPKFTRLLASLSDQQWEQMKGSGLRYDADLSPDQQNMLTTGMSSSSRSADLKGYVLTLDADEGAEAQYSFHLRAPVNQHAGEEIKWDWSISYYSAKVLQAEAWTPEQDTR